MSKISGLFKRKPKVSESGDNGAAAAPMSIGEPFNVVRNYHVNFDKSKGEFVGLPPAWRHLLEESDISKEEQKAHPEEVVNSLKTYAKSIKRKSSTTKFMLVATTIRESDELLESEKEGKEDGVFTDDKASAAAQPGSSKDTEDATDGAAQLRQTDNTDEDDGQVVSTTTQDAETNDRC